MPTDQAPRTSDWTTQAACLTADPQVFFPDVERLATLRDVRDAIPHCATCPVIRDCYQAAVRGREHGIWGGHLFVSSGQAHNIFAIASRPDHRDRRRHADRESGQ